MAEAVNGFVSDRQTAEYQPYWEFGRFVFHRSRRAALALVALSSLELLSACEPQKAEEPMWNQEFSPSKSFPSEGDAGGDDQKKGDAEAKDVDCEDSSGGDDGEEESSGEESQESSKSEEESGETDTDSMSEAEMPEQNDYKACNLAIEGISLNQAIETRLSDEGKELPLSGDRGWIVTDKEGMVRVYLDAEKLSSPRNVRVELTVESPGETWTKSVNMRITRSSETQSPKTTANFVVPERMIGEKSRYRVSLRQKKSCTAAPGDRPDLPNKGTWEIGARSAQKIPLSIIRINLPGYPAPEVDDDFMDRLNEETKARFPVAGVDFVSVSIPVMYAKTGVISNSSLAWKRLIDEVTKFAREEFDLEDQHVLAFARIPGVKDEFGVTQTLDSAKYSASILNLADMKETLVERSLRALAFMHGLDDADCQNGDDKKGYIGEWGYSSVTGQLLEPKLYQDLMCRKAKGWVHRANYERFGKRVEALF